MNFYLNTIKTSITQRHPNQINPQTALFASLPFLSLSLPPPMSFSACQIIYTSLSVFLRAQTQCVCTLTSCQRDKKSWQMVIWLYVCEANVGAISQWCPEPARPEGLSKMERVLRTLPLHMSSKQRQRQLIPLMYFYPFSFISASSFLKTCISISPCKMGSNAMEISRSEETRLRIQMTPS